MPLDTPNYLTPTSTWSPVYQLELADLVVGGPGGIDNEPHQNLANRTEYLRKTGPDQLGVYASTDALATALPPALGYRGKLVLVNTGGDTPDQLYCCMLRQGGAYDWVQLPTA